MIKGRVSDHVVTQYFIKLSASIGLAFAFEFCFQGGDPTLRMVFVDEYFTHVVDTLVAKREKHV